MNRRIVSGIHKWIGYILLVFYGVSVVGLIYYCAKSRIFPVSYLILTAAVLTIFWRCVSVDAPKSGPVYSGKYSDFDPGICMCTGIVYV